MKPATFLAICMAITVNALAQVRPVQTAPVKATTVVNNLSIKGPDLSVAITDISYKDGNYTISYTLKNNGTVNIDLKNVSMQGHIYASTGQHIAPGGGMILLYDGILNAGQEFKGKLGCTDKDVYKNWTYKYVLTADQTNAIAEFNENNNTAEYPILGYKEVTANMNINIDRERPLKGSSNNPPPAAPAQPTAPPPANLLPDLVITAASITKKPDNSFEVQYTMKNIGGGDVEINVNGIRSNGRVIDGPISKCNTYHFSNFPRKVLKPGETHINSYVIAPNLVNTLTSGQQYEYRITIDYIKDIRETNENNNDFTINFRPIF